MTLTFRYKTIQRPDGTVVKTPSIPVQLRGKENVDVIALIDSGADISVLPQGIAELLGLNVDGKRESAFGIGGTVACVQTTLSAVLAKGHEQYTFQLPVKVILGDYDLPILLGRVGFFDKFVITFNQAQETIGLKRVT